MNMKTILAASSDRSFFCAALYDSHGVGQRAGI